MMRAIIAALMLTACATAPPPPVIYPEAEFLPGHILAPIRAEMGEQIAFTGSTQVREGVIEVTGYRADGSYRFVVMDKSGRWVLTTTERVGDAPATP